METELRFPGHWSWEVKASTLGRLRLEKWKGVKTPDQKPEDLPKPNKKCLGR